MSGPGAGLLAREGLGPVDDDGKGVSAPLETGVLRRKRSPSAFLGSCYPYDLAPDGKRFAVVLNPDTAEESARKPTDNISIVLNIFDELRRKVPADRN